MVLGSFIKPLQNWENQNVDSLVFVLLIWSIDGASASTRIAFNTYKMILLLLAFLAACIYLVNYLKGAISYLDWKCLLILTALYQKKNPS